MSMNVRNKYVINDKRRNKRTMMIMTMMKSVKKT